MPGGIERTDGSGLRQIIEEFHPSLSHAASSKTGKAKRGVEAFEGFYQMLGVRIARRIASNQANGWHCKGWLSGHVSDEVAEWLSGKVSSSPLSHPVT